jgi:toxin ParE1/3/4
VVRNRRRSGRQSGLPEYRVIIANAAEQQLVDIAQWYEERNPRGTQRFVEAFIRLRRHLATCPRIGRARPELLERLRSWPIHPWTVFYSVNEHERQVEIEAVYHGAMDVDSDDFARDET